MFSSVHQTQVTSSPTPPSTDNIGGNCDYSTANEDGRDLRTMSMSDLGSILMGFGLDAEHVRGLSAREDRENVVRTVRRLRREKHSEEEDEEESDSEDDFEEDGEFYINQSSLRLPEELKLAARVGHPLKKERFTLFVRILLKFLERADQPMYAKCVRTIRDFELCSTASSSVGKKRSRSEANGSISVDLQHITGDVVSLRLVLRRVVGGAYWKRAVHFLNLFESRHLINPELHHSKTSSVPMTSFLCRNSDIEHTVVPASSETSPSVAKFKYFHSQRLSDDFEEQDEDGKGSTGTPPLKKAKFSNGDEKQQPRNFLEHTNVSSSSGSNLDFCLNAPTLQELLPSNSDLPLPCGISWSLILHRMHSHPHEISSYQIGTLPGQILHALVTRVPSPPPMVVEATIQLFPGGVLAETSSSGSPLRAACRVGAPLDILLLLFRAHVRLAEEGRTNVHPLREAWHPDMRPFQIESFLRDSCFRRVITGVDSSDGLGDLPLDDVISCFATRESPLWRSFADWDKLMLFLRASSMHRDVDEDAPYELDCSRVLSTTCSPFDNDERKYEEDADHLAPRFLPVHCLVKHISRSNAVAIDDGVLCILRFMQRHQPNQFCECDDDGLFPLHLLLSAKRPFATTRSVPSIEKATAIIRGLVAIIVHSYPAAAGEPDPDTGKLPLHAAIENGWPVEDILEAHPEALSKKERESGLFPFQLAVANVKDTRERHPFAVEVRSETESLECAFKLLRKDPTLIANSIE